MKVLKNEPMRLHTSFRAGGAARVYVIPEDREELQRLIRFLHEEGLAYKLLGNGSNLLVSDSGVDAVVVEVLRKLSGIRLEDAGESGAEALRVYAEAGALLSGTASFAAAHGLSGMETLHGIPGTVGGALTMNAGAYGGEIRDVLESCEVLSPEGELLRLPAEELELSYRHSCIPEKGYTVLSACFLLKKDSEQAIRARMEEYRRMRAEKQPLTKASAGSAFKRPEGDFAGRLIEAAGLRGYAVGDAQVSEKHCGFVVNNGNATASELYALLCYVIERVKEHSGITLTPEVRLWGSF